MERNLAAERKRIREDYEERIADCRAEMDRSWEAKRLKYEPTTDDPFEDINLRGERFAALLEEVVRRNQLIEGLRWERDQRLLELDHAEVAAEGECVEVEPTEDGPEERRSLLSSKDEGFKGDERTRVFTPDEETDELPVKAEFDAESDVEPDAESAAHLAAQSEAAAEPSAPSTTPKRDQSDSDPPSLPILRSPTKTMFLAILQLIAEQRKLGAYAALINQAEG